MNNIKGKYAAQLKAFYDGEMTENEFLETLEQMTLRHGIDEIQSVRRKEAEKDDNSHCRLCGNETKSKFNVDFKAVPICDDCVDGLILQQITFNIKQRKTKEKYKAELDVELKNKKEVKS